MKSHNYLVASLGAMLFTCTVPAATLYVDLNSPSPVAPYGGWATAARSIQDAVAAAASGDTILVTNGLYATGAYELAGLNRVLVTNAVNVRSVNGPAATTIQGYQLPETTNGPGAIRCAYLTNGASLSGFTLTGGATLDSGFAAGGGGVLCRESSAVVSNCVIAGNAARWDGGGVSGGTVQNSVLRRNAAGSSGGGSYAATLSNCLLTGNTAGAGGGDSGSTLYNCTLSGNAATNRAGGAFQSTLYNCILYDDAAPTNPEYEPGIQNYLVSCCCAGFNGGYGYACFSYEPEFVNRAAGDFHLQASSPCINAGRNYFVSNRWDIGGSPRIAGGTVDVGAYEFPNPTSVLSYAWARNHHLPVSGAADYLDADGDGSNNWHEWQSETDPENALSVFKILPPVADASGVTVSWNSLYGRRYHLERSTNLNASPAFTTIATNLFGSWQGTNSLTDAQATNAGPYFYRVVQEPQTVFGVVYLVEP